jgi:hypothetical protein
LFFRDRDNPHKKYPCNNVLQEFGILLGWCITVKNWWERLLTGDDLKELVVSISI